MRLKALTAADIAEVIIIAAQEAKDEHGDVADKPLHHLLAKLKLAQLWELKAIVWMGTPGIVHEFTDLYHQARATRDDQLLCARYLAGKAPVLARYIATGLRRAGQVRFA